MAASDLNNYQYWGLVGQGVSQATQSVVQGFGASAGLDIQAGAYGMTADMMEIQAEQETINAKMQATSRMEQYNQSAASNIAIVSAMGKTGENTTISDANLRAAEEDVTAIKSQGLMRNISARSGASAQRSAAKQSNIAADAAYKQAIAGAVSGIAGSVASYGMIAGSTKTKTPTTKKVK